MDDLQVGIRIICLDPPVGLDDGEAAVFGLQDKQSGLHFGTPITDDALAFDCMVTIKQYDGKPNFLGSFTHGTRQQRFLYLSYAVRDGEQLRWIKRIKIQLGAITWAQAEQVANDDRLVLQATVSGQDAATVPLLGDGWTVEKR